MTFKQFSYNHVKYHTDQTNLHFSLSETIIMIDDCKAYATWSPAISGGFAITIWKHHCFNLKMIVHEMSEIAIMMASGLYLYDAWLVHEVLIAAKL